MLIVVNVVDFDQGTTVLSQISVVPFLQIRIFYPRYPLIKRGRYVFLSEVLCFTLTPFSRATNFFLSVNQRQSMVFFLEMGDG